jgi:hypothetical protein
MICHHSTRKIREDVQGREALMSRHTVAGRRGFVLLTVVLVSTLLIVSSLMFGAQLLAESRISKTDAVFKSALSLAEVGLNTTLSEIRNGSKSDPSSSTWAERLQAGTDFVGPIVPVASMHGTYEADVAIDGSLDSLGGDRYQRTIVISSTGVAYPPSRKLLGSAKSADASSRRVDLQGSAGDSREDGGAYS